MHVEYGNKALLLLQSTVMMSVYSSMTTHDASTLQTLTLFNNGIDGRSGFAEVVLMVLRATIRKEDNLF